MRYLFFLFFFLNASLVCSQFCTLNDRFTEVEFFSSADIDSNLNVTYATNVLDWQGVPQDLEMDVYYPSSSVDTFSARPFVLLMHGGGFTNGNRSSMQSDCIRFAQRGYIAVTISYRLGWDQSNSTNQLVAAYRAQQDCNAAFRYSIEHFANTDIDTAWMFVGGRSAGAGTALNTVYADQQDWEMVVPGIEALEGDLVTSGNPYTHDFSLKGILNNWGATPGLAIEADEMLPTISFHGLLDTTVPIDSNSVNGFVGSGYIHNLLQGNGICSELTVDSLGSHGIYTNSAGSEFRVERASCFFKSIFCDECDTSYLTDAIESNCSTITSLADVMLNPNSIEFFPNPVLDLLNITGDLSAYQIEIISASGSILQVVNSTSASFFIDLTNLPQGLYLVKITNSMNALVEFQKIIKE